MIAVEVMGRGPKIAWEIVGIYRTPKEDMWLLKKLADQTIYMGSYMKRSIIRGNLTYILGIGMVMQNNLGQSRYFK
jgi:hypothetical protein